MSDNYDDLISRCLNGEVAAEYQLYHRIVPKMYGICLRYGGNETEAKDILQNGFMLLFRHLNQFRFEGSFEGWVQRIFVTTAVNYYRKNLKFRWAVEYTDSGEDKGLKEDALSALSTKDLLSIIQGLPGGCRVIFNMHVIENYEHKEIAGMLGISTGNSKSQLHRAKILIKQRLQEMEKERCLIMLHERK
ncbi:MAG: sigma-70 family RNA polymerase sigma factor [Bacteroidetes bacterium]|nr:sigma-70 family RNA polymerase sigma factor [Bacteroidota bacterium]